MYGAFFNLSIGMERLLKCVYLIDYFIENQSTFPSEKELKILGHDISRLYDVVRGICQRRGIASDFAAVSDPLNLRILAFLSNFASRARYSNLNNLQSGRKDNDPLVDWAGFLRDIYQSDVSAAKKRKVSAHTALMAPLLARSSIIIATGLEGESLDFTSGINQAGLVHESTPHAVWRVFSLIQPLRSVVDKIVQQAHERDDRTKVNMPTIPYMDEFLVILYRTKSDVLRRKTW